MAFHMEKFLPRILLPFLSTILQLSEERGRMHFLAMLLVKDKTKITLKNSAIICLGVDDAINSVV